MNTPSRFHDYSNPWNDGRHTISGVVRVALVRLGEFESGMTAVLLGAMPAVVLGGVGTIDVGRSLP